MEVRKAKMIVNTSGGKRGGGSTFRATLPTNWIREMGLDEDTRNLKLEFDGATITIKNNEKEMELLNNLLEAAKSIIENEINSTGYIDESDNNERFIDQLVYKYAEENEDLDFDEVLEMLEDYMKKTYKRKGECNDRGDYSGCFYKDKKGLKRWSGLGE